MISPATTLSVVPSAYSPAALLTALGNSLASPLLNRVFTVKGIYKIGKGVNYKGFCYDNLKDEFSDAAITLLTPQQLRADLRDGDQIEASVYLSKRVQPGTARIEIQLTINELLSTRKKTADADDVKALALIRQKAKAGLKDADALIKRKLLEQQPIAVTILIGQSAIIDQDILHQLKDAATAFKIRFVRINLALVAEIICALKNHQDTDILAIARGGGEHLNIFDHPAIAKAAIGLQPIFLTALGHTADEPLLQKVADKALITPTALGQYFHDLYTQTLEAHQGSNANIIPNPSKPLDLDQVTETIRTTRDTTKNILEQNRALYARMLKIRRANQVLGLAVFMLLLFILKYWSKHA